MLRAVQVDMVAGQDQELQRAMALSRATAAREEEERQVRLAIQESLLLAQNPQPLPPAYGACGPCWCHAMPCHTGAYTYALPAMV
jgi:hypothetical protein